MQVQINLECIFQLDEAKKKKILQHLAFPASLEWETIVSKQHDNEYYLTFVSVFYSPDSVFSKKKLSKSKKNMTYIADF